MQLQQLHGITTFINKVTVHKLSRCYSVANNFTISHISTLAYLTCMQHLDHKNIPGVNQFSFTIRILYRKCKCTQGSIRVLEKKATY